VIVTVRPLSQGVVINRHVHGNYQMIFQRRVVSLRQMSFLFKTYEPIIMYLRLVMVRCQLF